MRLGQGPASNVDWLYEVRNGRAFSKIVNSPAVAAQFSYAQLFNTAGSGKTVFLYEVLVQRATLGSVDHSFYAGVLATDQGTGPNLNDGAAASAAHAFTDSNAGVFGTAFASGGVPAGLIVSMFQPWQGVLDPTEAYTVRHTTLNEALNVVFRWVEK